MLPSDGIPTELHKIYCTENSKDDEIDPDRGPLDEIPFNEDTELSSTILNPVQLKPQKQLITDELLQNHKVNWPHRNSSPVFNPSPEENARLQKQASDDLVGLFHRAHSRSRHAITYKGGHVVRDALEEAALLHINLEDWACPRFDQLSELTKAAAAANRCPFHSRNPAGNCAMERAKAFET